MKISELIEILSKVKNKDLEICATDRGEVYNIQDVIALKDNEFDSKYLIECPIDSSDVKFLEIEINY